MAGAGASARGSYRALTRLTAAGFGEPKYIVRCYTRRQVLGYLDALSEARHTEEAFAWAMHRNIVLSGGRVKEYDIREYPEYESPEEGQLPENWEEVAASSPLVRRVEVPPQEPSSGDVQ